MIVFLNAFSLNFFPELNVLNLTIKKVSENDIKNIVNNNNFISFLGHNDLCEILNNKFETKTFEFNRSNFTWSDSVTSALIFQYKGTRLPEGSTVLPEGSTIEFYEVTVNG